MLNGTYGDTAKIFIERTLDALPKRHLAVLIRPNMHTPYSKTGAARVLTRGDRIYLKLTEAFYSVGGIFNYGAVLQIC